MKNILLVHPKSDIGVGLPVLENVSSGWLEILIEYSAHNNELFHQWSWIAKI